MGTLLESRQLLVCSMYYVLRGLQYSNHEQIVSESIVLFLNPLQLVCTHQLLNAKTEQEIF